MCFSCRPRGRTKKLIKKIHLDADDALGDVALLGAGLLWELALREQADLLF